MDITKTNNLQEIPATEELNKLCRTADTIRPGDYFLHGSDLLRVASLNSDDQKTVVRYELVWDIENEGVYSSYGAEEVNAFLKNKSYVPDPHKLYSQAVGIMDGTYTPEIPEEDAGPDDCTDDSTMLIGRNSPQSLIALAQKKQLLARQLSDLKQMADYHRSVLENRMRNKLSKLAETRNRIMSQLTNIQKALSMLQLYMGDEHCVEQLSSGANAPENEPFAIHQQLLFMDEECGIISDGGIDIERINEFEEWLMKEDHLDAILPDTKGIVALKPRRFRKDYGSSYYTAVMEHWNRHTFFLIRNGENVYLIDSNHIEITDRLFPLRSEMQELYDKAAQTKMEYEKEDSAKRIQSANERYHRIIFFIQGLTDNTEVLHPIPQGVNLFNTDSYAGWVRLVYDDEAALTDGRMSYRDWVKEINASVKRGSRIAYCPDNRWNYSGKGELWRYANKHFIRDYYNDYAVPDLPTSGIYTLDTVSKYGVEHLAFKYKPGDTIFSSDYYGKRRNRLAFIVGESDIYLNYDRISLDDIEYYLHSRIERKHYLDILPVLLEVRKNLRAEQQQENAFRLMLLGELLQQGISEEMANRHITEAIDWWKYKNIWKRPICNDDAKALRMIKSRVLKIIK